MLNQLQTTRSMQDVFDGLEEPVPDLQIVLVEDLGIPEAVVFGEDLLAEAMPAFEDLPRRVRHAILRLNPDYVGRRNAQMKFFGSGAHHMRGRRRARFLKRSPIVRNVIEPVVALAKKPASWIALLIANVKEFIERIAGLNISTEAAAA